MRALSRPTKKVLTILMQDGMEMVGQSLLREVAGVVHANDASGTGAVVTPDGLSSLSRGACL